MKKVLYSITFLFLISSQSFGQIVINNGTFPEADDTLKNLFTSSPGTVDVGSAGADVFWDFSMIQARNELDIIFAEPSQGNDSHLFPGADLVSFIPPGNERYITVSATEVAELGFVGLDPVVQDFKIATFYTNPYVLQRAPLKYGDTNSGVTKIVTTIDFDSIPDSLKVGLSIIPDSIRVTVEINRESEVDAWGEVRTISGTFEVLRERSTENRTTLVEALSIFGWSDVTALIRTILPDPTLLDPSETKAFIFLSNEKKEPIATLTLDSNDVVDRVQLYRARSVSTRNHLQQIDVRISPNPTYGKTTLYYNGIESGKYNLHIYDILGNELSVGTYHMDNSGSIKCDFSQLGKGTYLYSLKDSNGDILTTKRMVILNP